MQDPEIYLGEIGVPVNDLFDPSRPARVDVFHRSRVNYETYFFADTAGKARFDADPIAHAGVVTDPVSRQRFRPLPSSPRLLHDGRPYVFFSEESRAAFVAMPDMYAELNAKMLPAAPGTEPAPGSDMEPAPEPGTEPEAVPKPPADPDAHASPG